ncbi:hypothetical protein B0T22DRAFT_440224 [Podospora appendiculata]|uniref:ABM domain-containing protein n=1 Tax=Podospora appendiculata TaxID=314037 RepID=A0AAE1CCS8_9PEZI|nr:hypothetical protein B0T22DRAFT_440224 [Podospora appendiculata]
MSLITEFQWVPFKADAMSSPAGSELKKLVPEMRARPGLLHTFHGAPIEKPQSREFVHVWESESAYRDSKTLPVQAQASQLFRQLIDTSETAFAPFRAAVALDRPFAAVAAAPVVSLAFMMLGADVDVKAFEAAWTAATASVAESGSKPAGFVAGASGWAVEGKVFVVVSGWESVEANEAAHETTKAAFGAIRGFEKTVEVHHTSFSAPPQ